MLPCVCGDEKQVPKRVVRMKPAWAVLHCQTSFDAPCLPIHLERYLSRTAAPYSLRDHPAQEVHYVRLGVQMTTEQAVWQHVVPKVRFQN